MNLRCPKCRATRTFSDNRIIFVKMGFFRRKSTCKWVQRYRCKTCLKSFSQATADPCYYQKKRHLNQVLFDHLSSGTSQRRACYLLKVNRKTVKRKFIFLGQQALLELRKFNQTFPLCSQIEFDDLETFEHSKCKPLSVTLSVEPGSRRLLGFSVSSMPAKGRLAIRSIRKYGPRADNRAQGRALLLSMVKGLSQTNVIIKSDQNPHYGPVVEKYFPEGHHIAFKGRRGAITGQGELKKTVYDPLFSLNHTCAKLRADINRLIRRTWCTTKKAERLRYHLAIYSLYHNQSLYAPKRV